MKIEFTYTELNQIIKNYIEQKYNYSKIKIKKFPKISQFNSTCSGIAKEYGVCDGGKEGEAVCGEGGAGVAGGF